ncbi:nucleoside triphosphate pyrophosphohydrolase family protein [Actinoplanes sp. NPDC049802]|uniref:nucleoside triphosphate pyrophosphohydrolase family protein n=1 Tax=Actinoplanes sp. NPDC049802 TaxID=3154742 RepID=UPI0033DE6B59
MPSPSAAGTYCFAVDLDEYQRGALRTAASRDKKNELLHLVLGLVGESGEVAEKFKKWVRDLDSDETRIDRADIAKELGDLLWYVAVLADYLDLSLDDIGAANLAKLASRQTRGVLGGSGDDR